MTTLTDLPNEIIETIFREFLSKELTNHKYLCKWEVEPDAARTRANLCSLSLVSQRLSAIAVPLLYEQLWDFEDIEVILKNWIRHGTDVRQIAPVRYLMMFIRIPAPAGEDHEVLKRIPDCLTYCTDVSHVRLWISGISTDTSAFLLSLAGLPGLRNLQSLSLSLRSAEDGRHNLFEDCAQFPCLNGLRIGIRHGVRCIGQPDQPLAGLKQLEALYLGNERETSACMALAPPDGLEVLTFEGLHDEQEYTSFAQILGSHTWKRLAFLHLDCATRLARDTFATGHGQLPVLQTLYMSLSGNRHLSETLPILPSGLVSFCIGPCNMDQLLETFTLIASSDLLGRRMQRIGVIFDNLPDGWWFGEHYTKEHLLSIARTAIEIIRSKGVVVEPEDILDKLAGLDIWRHWSGQP